MMRRLLLCVAMLAVLAGCSDGDRETEGELSGQTSQAGDDPAAPSTDSPLLNPPAGLTTVGLGRVAMLVPAGMSRQVTSCSRKLLVRDGCLLLRERGRARLHISLLPLDRVDRGLFELTKIETGSGLDALVGDACSALGYCAFSHGRILTVPDEDVALVVTGDAEDVDTIRRIIGSVALVPDGYTTVPPILRGSRRSQFEAAIEAAGLDPYANRPDSDFKVYGTSPDAGSVLEEGSTVNLLWRSPKVMSGKR